MNQKQLLAWIDTKLAISQESYDEAEADRTASGFTNVDALEQSAYNEGVLDILSALKGLLTVPNEVEINDSEPITDLD